MKLVMWNGSWSFCLGNIIVMQKGFTINDYKHEYGHHLQYKKLGILYYFKIGIPSIIGWWIDVLFHKNWSNKDRIRWYYNQPWEKEADYLGGVTRIY